MGWRPAEVRASALAEFWAHYHGHGLAQGWFRASGPGPLTHDELRDLMEAHPDG